MTRNNELRLSNINLKCSIFLVSITHIHDGHLSLYFYYEKSQIQLLARKQRQHKYYGPERSAAQMTSDINNGVWELHPLLGQLNPTDALTHCLFQNHFDTVLLIMSRHQNASSLLLKLSVYNVTCNSILTKRAKCYAHLTMSLDLKI
jgi:hypothetical protein